MLPTRFASLRGTKQSRQEASTLDCFVVPPRNDGGWGRSYRVSVTCRRMELRFASEAKQSTMTRFASLRGTKQSRQEALTLDCFVVPPRNDAKRLNGRKKSRDAINRRLYMTCAAKNRRAGAAGRSLRQCAPPSGFPAPRPSCP